MSLSPETKILQDIGNSLMMDALFGPVRQVPWSLKPERISMLEYLLTPKRYWADFACTERWGTDDVAWVPVHLRWIEDKISP
jgi:hypothetical protein